MEAIENLRAAGYTVQLDGGEIHCLWSSSSGIDRELVLPLLEDLRRHKAQALTALEQERGHDQPLCKPPDRMSIQELAGFVRWVSEEARRFPDLVGNEQRLAIRRFERRCSLFDALPKDLKVQAIELAERNERGTREAGRRKAL